MLAAVPAAGDCDFCFRLEATALLTSLLTWLPSIDLILLVQTADSHLQPSCYCCNTTTIPTYDQNKRNADDCHDHDE